MKQIYLLVVGRVLFNFYNVFYFLLNKSNKQFKKKKACYFALCLHNGLLILVKEGWGNNSVVIFFLFLFNPIEGLRFNL